MNVHLLKTCVLTNASTLKEVTCALVTMATYWTGTSSTVQVSLLQGTVFIVLTVPRKMVGLERMLTCRGYGGLRRKSAHRPDCTQYSTSHHLLGAPSSVSKPLF